MLAKYYRFRVLSELDETLTYDNAARVNVRFLPWKMTSGALVYGTVIIDDLGFDAGETIATDGESEGDVQDNTSNLYLGGKGYFEIIADVSGTDGTIYLYMEESDDNSNWPSDQADFDITTDMILVCALAMSTDAVDEGRSKNFEIVA
ncbi:hypothetical protein KAR91_48705 [Candidatus Pacearchaeota archaeon]|nr:hypothetical protein [Candidatus Pacearchaeota archaeon]